MHEFSEPLPIDDALPRLTAALRADSAAVLVAPPGAGKTTRVPLVLLDEAWAKEGAKAPEPDEAEAAAAAAAVPAAEDAAADGAAAA